MLDIPDELIAEVVERTQALALIPAPTLAESERAGVVARWWRDDSLAAVGIDNAGNVWARMRSGSGPAIVVCAHLDTVFGPDITHGVRSENGRLVGPGVGDDTVGVAALATLGRLLPPATRHPIWILATVAEEGLGNLAGATAALTSPEVRIGAFLAVEGNYLGRVNVTGIGSLRWHVLVSGQGGHAWECADAPSAIHGAATLIERLAGLRTSTAVSVNVGHIEGGEAINARARRCSFDVDLRADTVETLRALAAGARQALAAVPVGLRVEIQEIGCRPAGRIAVDHPLVGAAVAALEAEGLSPALTAASTDANAAYAAGIPAVTLGVAHGAGEHTEDEWIDPGSLARGLRALAATVIAYDSQMW